MNVSLLIGYMLVGAIIGQDCFGLIGFNITSRSAEISKVRREVNKNVDATTAAEIVVETKAEQMEVIDKTVMECIAQFGVLLLLFSIGIGLKYKLSKNWAVSTGIRYSYMQRSFVGDYQGEGFRIVQTDIMNHQHWLGIPLNLSYEFVKKGRWNVYATAGGAAEWLLDNKFVVHNSPQDILYHNNRGKTQFSAMAGVGMEYRISPFVGLYLDPGFRYYFATWNQPRSIRTVQPLRFEIEAGLRFNLRR